MALRSRQSTSNLASFGERGLPASALLFGALIATLLGTWIGVGLLAIPACAAESITAHLDAAGRLVFVNEDQAVTPPQGTPASKAVSSITKGGRVIASSGSNKSSPDNSTDKSAKDAGAAPEQPASVASGPAVPDQEASSEPAPAANLDAMIEQEAARHQIDPGLVKAIVRVESNYNPDAVSPAGAEGLMQLIPATAMRFGVANPFDPQANLDGGIRYLKYLLGQYGGNLQLTLAAYNAGEDAVARSGGTIPSYRETQDYIRKIARLYPQQTTPWGAPPEPSIEKFVDSSGVVHFSNTDF